MCSAPFLRLITAGYEMKCWVQVKKDLAASWVGSLEREVGRRCLGQGRSRWINTTGTGTTTHPDSANLWASAPAVTSDKWAQMIIDG